MIRYPYFTQVDPPAPFVRVHLRNAVTGAEARDVLAQIDTGAYRTVVPQSVADAIALVPLGLVAVGGVGGAAVQMPGYAVWLVIHTLPARWVEVLAHPGEPCVLLGRDVLNAFRLVLDGPWRVLDIG